MYQVAPSLIVIQMVMGVVSASTKGWNQISFVLVSPIAGHIMEDLFIILLRIRNHVI
jgi:hypothetical protein